MKTEEKLSPFHSVILIHMIQTGVALFSLPRVLAVQFGTNGWLAVFLFGAIVAIHIWLMSYVYRHSGGRSIFDILEQSIPKFVLSPVYIGLICVWAMLCCLVSKEYILIFKMVAFPTTNPMIFELVVNLLTLWLLGMGVYNIAKAATVFFWFVIWMVFLLTFFYGEFRWARLTPFVFQGGELKMKELYSIYAAFFGYELVLLLFPYANPQTKLMRAAMAGNGLTVAVYLYTCLIAFGFFSLQQLKEMLFPVLDLLAYIKLPFIERIENLLYGFFLFTILITAVMYVWSAKEVSRRMFPRIKGGVLGFIILTLAYLVSYIPDVLSEVLDWLQIFSVIEFWIAFGLPALVGLVLLVQRRRGQPSNG
ncbi:spore gernimation protein [Gordoniibacillus kamchatkensis]|uniref:Spore gernimation protein n=1 Tax=Gordoniibacillus kamchatkensis TaxID=1590651 RepID=A0ABR5AFI8_9BACL|nr:GerAB/ArcD/ProY family transporter [Paenibacillus sp. VKM B-2647]KIL39821.1 spore gernimation protein [Paenibacillus sp. VKM B-2647]